MSELMGNEGRIIAVEKYLSRVETMNRNIDRLGIKNIRTIHDDISEPKSSELRESLIGKADKILVDAPCSGLGVLSKKPDIKWKRELEDIYKLQKLQLELLENCIKYLKPGGVIVYSTCTTEPEENSEVAEAFLRQHGEFEAESASEFLPETVVNEKGCMELLPHVHKTDGAFAVRFRHKA